MAAFLSGGRPAPAAYAPPPINWVVLLSPQNNEKELPLMGKVCERLCYCCHSPRIANTLDKRLILATIAPCLPKKISE